MPGVAPLKSEPYARAVGILSLLIDVYSLVVFVSVLCSWLSLAPDHPVLRVTGALTEPLLSPIRRLLPATAGLDISPMLLLLALRLVKRLLVA